MFAVFQGVFTLGKPLQDGLAALFDLVRQQALAPAFAPLPACVRGFLLDGLWSGVSTVATFVPLVVLFFLFMALVEDTGLPVARRVPHRRADGAHGPRRPQLRDGAAGLRLQRAGGDGHAHHALARRCAC